jgi:phage terminase small subunit
MDDETKLHDKRLPRCPSGLSAESRGWWRRVNSEWQLQDSDLLPLEHALRSLDLLRQAEAAVEREGLTIVDRFQQRKGNPNLLVIRDARNQLLKFWKALQLKAAPAGFVEPPWAK